MVLYADKIVLLDRTAGTAWSGGDPIGSTDLPSTTDPLMSGNGDMTPWRIRLDLTNTGVTGEVNYGVLKLRVDEQQTFVNSGPILINEDAKKKYLIEAYIVQSDADGSNVESKRFRFQLGSPSMDVDKNLGSVLTITLQEIQYRMKESVSSRELRFVTPKEALDFRIIDHNNHQVSGVTLLSTNNKLPDVEELQQHYIPQSPQPIHTLIDKIFDRLQEPAPIGGVFKDFYYDFDPTASTLTTDITADEIGRVDTGVIISPISAEVIDSDTEQTATTDFVRYKNHVILRGTPNGGSLPPEHSRFSSKWLHAKLRPEWSVSNSVNDRGGTAYNYLQGQTVKITYDTGITGLPKIIRFFRALQNVTTPPPKPDVSPTNWEEDFIIYPAFNPNGGYEENDVVYLNTGPDIRFYRAKRDVIAFTLNGFRTGKDNTDPLYGTSGLNQLTVGGLLRDPDIDTDNWEDLSAVHSGGGDIVTAHATTSFVGWIPYSPWTDNLFSWEKNMVGLKSGSMVTVSGDHYVGLTPDWNMARDVYNKQDVTDDFETITLKWVTKVGVNDVVVGSPTATQINEDEVYHGNRVIVGTLPTTDFTTDYNNQFSSGTANNKLAEYDTTVAGADGKGIWRFSVLPVTGDIVTNLDDGKLWYWTGSAWAIGWEYAGATNRWNPKASGAWSHPVKDVYKVQGFEGTPSSAIEFRYVWDSELLNDNPLIGDNDTNKALKGRSASRGAWLWFWNPFPRLPEGGNEIGSSYGGHGTSPAPASGFTTLNTFGNTNDSKQSLRGFNNGLDSEDLGKINGLSFKLKVGVFADSVSEHNDLEYRKLGFPIIGMESVPMIFWAIDDFERIWFKRFSLRRNNEWDLVNIEFGDLSQRNLYIPRWDELPNLLGVPLSGFNFLLKEREYTGVRFDWRFVRGWGVMLADGYDDSGFYNGGIDSKRDQADDIISQVEHAWEAVYVQAKDVYDSINTLIRDGIEAAREQKFNVVTTKRVQATIAIDDLYYSKELVVNSDDTTVNNARTKIAYDGSEDDYLNAKVKARGMRERDSFYPQFWNFRAIGNVKLRVGQSFKIAGDRIPDHPDQYPVYNSGSTYNAGDKVSFNDGTNTFSYRALASVGTTQSPTANPELWENMNELSISTVKHIIDGTGYHVEVVARRKFITTGE